MKQLQEYCKTRESLISTLEQLFKEESLPLPDGSGQASHSSNAHSSDAPPVPESAEAHHLIVDEPASPSQPPAKRRKTTAQTPSSSGPGAFVLASPEKQPLLDSGLDRPGFELVPATAIGSTGTMSLELAAGTSPQLHAVEQAADGVFRCLTPTSNLDSTSCMDSDVQRRFPYHEDPGSP